MTLNVRPSKFAIILTMVYLLKKLLSSRTAYHNMITPSVIALTAGVDYHLHARSASAVIS